jgi:imidazolonepropionase
VFICAHLWLNTFMLIHSANQLLTLGGGPQRGHILGALGIIENGAVVIRGETIQAVGPTAELKAAYAGEPTLDASGCVVMPGFVDPHTHVIWAGDRAGEFAQKMAGTPYLDILAAGGGIISTVKATRKASIEALIGETRPRLLRMFAHGTTTAEAKTGYGLQTATELRPCCRCSRSGGRRTRRAGRCRSWTCSARTRPLRWTSRVRS